MYKDKTHAGDGTTERDFSGVTRGGGQTAPGDTLQGVTPEGKFFCGQIYEE